MSEPENTTDQYKAHSVQSDNIIKTLKELVVMNKIMHDGLTEAQTMIGQRDLAIIRMEREIEGLRKKLSEAS